LTADIQPPDFETRMAILRSKAERARYNISDQIIEIIARKFQSNIRELEGALTRIVAYADLRGVSMTPELIDSALADLLPRRKEVKPDHVINTVADAYNVAPDRMLGRDRSRQVALPRQIAMYLMREEGKISLPQIGEALGGRDHTTVMYGCDKIADLLERDDKIRREVIEIREQLYGQSAVIV
jgi:chromosomal replication initiator protein